MSNPNVACVMLANGRKEMVVRAIACYQAQTYTHKSLYILDTGANCVVPVGFLHSHMPKWEGRSIGALRNEANSMTGSAHIIAHLDSDDHSHPNRLTEQVALLQASGAECVGYNSMLFWDTTKCQIEVDPSRRGPDGVGCLGTVKSVGEAWLYRAINPKHILGTSMMYWRSTWERQPFDDINHGEDTRWAAKVKVCGVSSLHEMLFSRSAIDVTRGGLFGGPADTEKRMIPGPTEIGQGAKCDPRMVASVHGGNSSGYAPEKDRTSTRRVPEWDDFCRKVMQL